MDDEGEEERKYKIPVMNFQKCVQGQVLDEEYQSVLERCQPRVAGTLYIRPKHKRARTPWSLPISLFKDYKIDTEVLTSSFETLRRS